MCTNVSLWTAGIFAVAVALVAACSRAVIGSADESIVIRNVTVISPEREIPEVATDVLIRNGRITAVGADLDVGADAHVMEGQGRFLIPGLIDSHVHVHQLAGLDEDVMLRRPELVTH